MPCLGRRQSTEVATLSGGKKESRRGKSSDIKVQPTRALIFGASLSFVQKNAHLFCRSYTYVLIKFSIISCRPLGFGVASPFSSMIFSSDLKLCLPASISLPRPLSQLEYRSRS